MAKWACVACLCVCMYISVCESVVRVEGQSCHFDSESRHVVYVVLCVFVVLSQ